MRLTKGKLSSMYRYLNLKVVLKRYLHESTFSNLSLFMNQKFELGLL